MNFVTSWKQVAHSFNIFWSFGNVKEAGLQRRDLVSNQNYLCWRRKKWDELCSINVFLPTMCQFLRIQMLSWPPNIKIDHCASIVTILPLARKFCFERPCKWYYCCNVHLVYTTMAMGQRIWPTGRVHLSRYQDD